MLRLSLLAQPSWICAEYCRFQRTSSIDGRWFGSPDTQLRDISAAVLKESTAKVPRMVGSAMLLRSGGLSVKLFCS